MGTIRTIEAKPLRPETHAQVVTRRMAHKVLEHQARRTGMTCRWNGSNVEGYIKGLKVWVTVWRAD